jgi:hypothetical protein
MKRLDRFNPAFTHRIILQLKEQIRHQSIVFRNPKKLYEKLAVYI